MDRYGIHIKSQELVIVPYSYIFKKHKNILLLWFLKNRKSSRGSYYWTKTGLFYNQTGTTPGKSEASCLRTAPRPRGRPGRRRGRRCRWTPTWGRQSWRPAPRTLWTGRRAGRPPGPAQQTGWVRRQPSLRILGIRNYSDGYLLTQKRFPIF